MDKFPEINWRLWIGQKCFHLPSSTICTIIGLSLPKKKLYLQEKNFSEKMSEFVPICRTLEQISNDEAGEFLQTFFPKYSRMYVSPEFSVLTISLWDEKKYTHISNRVTAKIDHIDWFTERGVDCRHWIQKRWALAYHPEIHGNLYNLNKDPQ